MRGVALLLPPAVFKQLAGLPKADAKRLLERPRTIAAAPDARHAGVMALVGEAGAFRVRQGDWRAVFTISEGDVIVDRVAHRRDVYR